MSKQPHRDVTKREEEKQQEGVEVKEEDYLFTTEELTETEKRSLNYRRTVKDVDVAKEEDERRNRCHLGEDKSRKVPHTHTHTPDCCVCELNHHPWFSLPSGGLNPGWVQP